MTAILPPENREDVDRLLESFFRSEMPDPWPALNLPASGRASQPLRRSWWRRFGRLAVAACIALFLLGYLSLASFFPREPSRPELNPGREIGNPAGPNPSKLQRQNPLSPSPLQKSNLMPRK